MWDIRSQRLIRTIDDCEEDSYRPRAAAMYNGNILMTGGSNGDIRLWNINSGEHIKSFRAHLDRVISLAPSVDQQLIVSGGQVDGIKIWSAASFELLAALTAARDDAYILRTPWNEFHVSDSGLLQFEQVSQRSGRFVVDLVTDEEQRTRYRERFIDLAAIRRRLARNPFDNATDE